MVYGGGGRRQLETALVVSLAQPGVINHSPRPRATYSRTFRRSVAGQYQPLATSELPEELEDGEPGIPHSIPPYGSYAVEKVEGSIPLSVGQTAEIALTFCWLWFIANWTVNASLNYTTVTSSTIVSSTSGK